jgi:hypothetical protein
MTSVSRILSHVFRSCRINANKTLEHTQEVQTDQPIKHIKIQFDIASRDDLLRTAVHVVLNIRASEVHQPKYRRKMCSNIRQALTTECCVHQNEEIVMQAWDIEKQQWGWVEPVLMQACSSNTLNKSCIIQARICRAELHHLFVDKHPPHIFRG